MRKEKKKRMRKENKNNKKYNFVLGVIDSKKEKIKK